MKRYVRAIQLISILLVLLILSGCGWAYPPKVTGGEVTIDKNFASDEGKIIITIDPVNSLDNKSIQSRSREYVCPLTGKKDRCFIKGE